MKYTPKPASRELFEVILLLKTEAECTKFFRDLLTEAEIKEFSNRWKVANMLNKKIDYKTIETETKMSSTTIARISKWLNSGMGGYRLMLNRLSTHHPAKSIAG